jgi:phosphatidate phosphatase PAH1
VLGKFAYGPIDKDIHDEEVDIWLNRDCGDTWEKLGTELTTQDDQHPPVEGVDDTGGRIYFQIPEAQKLGIGRHRIYMSVAGDLTGAVQYIEVMPAGTVYFITDVDGTLTTKETEEYSAILTASTSDANPYAPEALTMLNAKGYRPYYLTARPEFLIGRTREFIKERGFPLGVVHTTMAYGATGSAAGTFKLAELKELEDRGFSAWYAFGNTASDADAFFMAAIEPSGRRIFYQYTDSAHGGRRIDSYQELLGDFGALTAPCQ